MKYLLATCLTAAGLLFTSSALAYESFGGPTGVLRWEKGASYEGYTLIAPHGSTTTYLIDMEGNIAKTWKHATPPGLFAQLLPDGSLLRTMRFDDRKGLKVAGFGGGFQKIDWNGNVLMEFVLNDDDKVLTHGVTPMPNGNVLCIGREFKSMPEALAKGRRVDTPGATGLFNTDPLVPSGVWPPFLIEVDPKGNIVWEYHKWDYTGTGPDQYDINYITPNADLSGEALDWSYYNGVDYDPATDRVVISDRQFSEVYIIDKKTKKLVWRWGNPATFGAGRNAAFVDDGDRKLFGPHNSTFLPNGNVQVFNNGWMRPTGNYSEVLEIDPRTDQVVWRYRSQRPMNFSSPYQSGAQRLANGNTLITSCNAGHIFEVTGGPEPRVVWEFISPWMLDEGPRCFFGEQDANSWNVNWIADGNMKNSVHRAYRYAADFPGFKGRDLTPKGYFREACIRAWEMEPWKSGSEEYAKLMKARAARAEARK